MAKREYDNIINEQLKDEVIEQCESDTFDCKLMYYVPHSLVVKKNASKTKVLVVFDASSKCTNGIFLNDCLIPDPNLNPSVLNLVLCFNRFKHAFFADNEKVYLQIGISEIGRDVL